MRKTRITILEMINVIDSIDKHSFIGQRDRAILSILTTIRHHMLYKSFNVLPILTLNEFSTIDGCDFISLCENVEFIEKITDNLLNWKIMWCEKYLKYPAFPRLYLEGRKMYFRPRESQSVEYLNPKYISKIIDRRIQNAGIEGSFGFRSFF